MNTYVRQLTAFWQQPGTLMQGMLRGFGWVFLSQVSEQLITFARTVLLARLLTPTDFGLIGLVSLATAALSVFTEIGVWPALLQRKELDEDTINTAWVILALRGFGLAVIIVLIAPVVSVFFSEPLLNPLLRTVAAVFVLSGFNSVGLILLQRELQFAKLTYLHITATAASFVLSVATAYYYRTVWAFVVGQLAGAAVTLFLSYVIHDFRPRFRFSWTRATGLFRFGRFLTLSGIINYLGTQGDDALVGKVLGSDSLGFYGVAYRASNLPATAISHVINRVTLPAFSKMQDDVAKLSVRYLQTLHVTALIVIPVSALLFALAPVLIPVLYGPQWETVVTTFMILCVFGLERAIGSVSGPVFIAMNHPALHMNIQAIKLFVMVVLILPLTLRYGIVGTSLAVTASALVVQVFVLFRVAHLLKIAVSTVLRQLLEPSLASLFTIAVVVILQRELASGPSLVTLGSLLVVGSVLYLAIIVILKRAALLRLHRATVALIHSHATPD